MKMTSPSSIDCACTEGCHHPQEDQPINRKNPSADFIPKQIFLNAAKCGQLTQGADPEALYQSINWMFNDMRPKNAIEGILASQIISTYLVMNHQLYLSTKETFVEGTSSRINMVAKLQKVMSQQMDLLTSTRGEKPPQQVMRIERVNVTDGAQAVIGSVGRG